LSDEVKLNKYCSKERHRGYQGEGQLHFNRDNICEFDNFWVSSDELQIKMIDALKRQQEKKSK
jgi:hypothetical protein